MPRHDRTAFLWTLAAAAAIAGCAAGDEPLGVELRAATAASIHGGGRLGVYNDGVDRAVPRRPCARSTPHRAFDFWIGEWDIGGGNTSRVSAILDGCVILEEYLFNLGVTGRSISTYDADTRQWHQTWVANAPFSPLQLAGAATATGMHMSQRLVLPFATFVTDYEWTRIGRDEVIQAWTVDRGPFGAGGSSVTYARTRGLVQGTPVPVAACREGAGANNTVLDFMHGEWRVKREHGQTLARATIEPQVGGCLTTMRFRTRKGYEAVAFTYYDANVQRFRRTYVDSEGERIELIGFIEDAALVMYGVEPGPRGEPVDVRVVVRDPEPGLFTESWEVSNDGGQTWKPDLFVRFVRR